MKVGLSPKTDKALLPGVKPGTTVSGQAPAVRPRALRTAEIISLRLGQTFSTNDKLTLKAGYDRSHKVISVLQQKRGNRYKATGTKGNGNFGQLRPGNLSSGGDVCN